MDFLKHIAEFFLGVTVPTLLCLWALLGNKGIRMMRRAGSLSEELLKNGSDDN